MHPKLIEIVTEDVSKLFRLESQWLFELKLEYGMKYIEERYKHEPHIAEGLRNSPLFWHWWRELWAKRDRQLMKACERKAYGVIYTYYQNGYIGSCGTRQRNVFHEELQELYEDYHYWTRVVFYPNPVMIEACIH